MIYKYSPIVHFIIEENSSGQNAKLEIDLIRRSTDIEFSNRVQVGQIFEIDKLIFLENVPWVWSSFI